jgi:ATP phosphoribosyltransferase
MLRLGISKQERVFGPTKETLNSAGYPLRNFNRTEEVDLREEDLRLIGVKDIDQVAFMIEDGELDGLLLGADIAYEAQSRISSQLQGAVNPLFDLERAKCRISPIGMPDTLGKLDWLLSKYPGLSRQYLEREEFSELLKLNAKEIQVRPFGSGADVQIRRALKGNQMATDIVETGNTVRQNGGKILDEIEAAQEFGLSNALPSVMDASIQLFAVGNLDSVKERTMSEFQQRIELVINAEKYRLIKYNVPNAILDQVLKLTPERENPTITPTGEGYSAV